MRLCRIVPIGLAATGIVELALAEGYSGRRNARDERRKYIVRPIAPGGSARDPRIMPATSESSVSLGPVIEPGPPAPAAAPASDRGLGLLFRFLIATSIAVAAFMLAVAVDQMWILVPVMAIHLSVTFLVLKGIFNLLRD